MSNINPVRKYLTVLSGQGISVPPELFTYLTALESLQEAAETLISSADDTGCDASLTVVDSGYLKQVRNQIFELDRPLEATGEVSIQLTLSTLDRFGELYGEIRPALSTAAISEILSIAVHAANIHGKGFYLGDVLDELVESLETRDLLNHQGELDLSKCTVEVTFDVDTSDGLQDPDLGAAVHALTGRRVLIDRTHVAGASALHMNTSYPNASKYGIPEVATIQGAKALASHFGLEHSALELATEDTGDDSADQVVLTVRMPATAVYLGGMSLVRETPNKSPSMLKYSLTT
ncbi:hypothetical protein [Pseudomonas mohnii]